MGTVFEAEDTVVGRRVAIKVLEPWARLSKVRARRFVREARAAARVDHPNVVTIYDVGPDRLSGALFIVQELLQGIDLREQLRRMPEGCLPVDSALGLLLPIAEALEAAHQLGIVHRDVTPANVFLSEQPGNVLIPKLIDFGLAERIDRRARFARLDRKPRKGEQLYGTPQYMAPEILRGEAPDARSDLWSFGAVLYRCISGRAPNQGELVPIDELVEIDADLAATIHRAIHPEPDHRFGSMTDLLRALSRQHRRESAPPSHASITSISWAPSSPSVRSQPAARRGLFRAGLPRFGLVTAGREERQIQALEGLSQVLSANTEVVVCEGYPQLVDALAEGRVDVAWLPPVAYVRAMRAHAARLLFTVQRDGRRSYSSALVAREPVSLEALAGLHAAWVDPWSAAGWLVPRRMLRMRGVDPNLAFRRQTFVGSYANVLAALATGEADVGAIPCRVLPDGRISSSVLEDARLHVLAVSEEGIPGDTLCASSALDATSARDAATRCIDALMHPALQPALRALLGTDRFVAANPSRYDALEAALIEDVDDCARLDHPAASANG